LITNDPSTFDCRLFVKTNDVNIKGSIRKLATTESFTKYKYRQQTQELLYEVNTKARMSTVSPLSMRKKRRSNRVYQLTLEQEEEEEGGGGEKQDTLIKELSLKERMTALLENMKMYMNTLTLANENDKKFMKLLCDDMYVCIQTHGTPHAKMYSCTRHLSQGSQRVYSSGKPASDIDFYQISDYSETPYSSRSVQSIMTFLDDKDELVD